MLRTLLATRYVTPLREGGSLPAVVEANDDGMYVLKFRGAGQGIKSLIAELVAGEIARSLGLPVPELVLMELDPALGRNEPDFEIQALLKASEGLNLALDYLPGSLGYDPLLIPSPEPALASLIVWFDAYVTNVDRTPRNPNMLIWHKKLWLIDNAASLIFHHTWADYLERAKSPFTPIKDHVLLPFASQLQGTDALAKQKLNSAGLTEILSWLPDEWLQHETQFATPAEHRQAYHQYLTTRLENSAIFVQEAINARAKLV